MDRRTLSAHVLKTLAEGQLQGAARPTLEDLVANLGVRRRDVREAVSALHREGYVDALTMKLTFAGFAIGASLRGAELRPLRVARVAVAAA